MIKKIVLTKMDKIKEGQLFNKCLAIGHQLMKFQNVEYIVHAASSKTGFGIDHLKYSIIEAFLRYPTRDLKGKEESLIKHLLENKTLRPKRKKPAIMQKSGRIRKIRSQKPAELVGNENK